jgi:PAS domain S-box-containing protein
MTHETSTKDPVTSVDMRLFEATPGMRIICLPDAPHFTIFAASIDLLQFVGYQKEQVVGKSIFEAFPANPADTEFTGHKNLRASLEHVVLHKTAHQMELQRYDVAIDGGDFKQIFWQNKSIPVLDNNGEVAYIIHTTENITAKVLSGEQKEAYLQLQNAYRKIEESQDALKRFKFMADNAQDPFILMREDGSFAYLNQKAMEAWGYTAEEAKSIRVADVDPIYQDDAFAEVFAKAQKNEILQFETLHKRKDGLIYPVEVNMNGVTLNGIPHMFAVARNITARKEQEEAIEAQNVLIRTITDNATSTLFMMNAKGYCTFMNTAGEKMFGYSQEEIRSKPLHYLIHHHRPDGSLYPMEECPLDRALPDNFDVRAHRDLFFRKDGSSFPITCAASPIFENGVPVATVIEVRDISLEVEAEQALRRSAAELEELVEERTKELLHVNDQLQQFTYAASHDLQEPLRKISFFLERLMTNLGTDLNADNKVIADRIRQTTERMRTLINDLLTYSHTTLGSTGFQPVQLSSVVKDVLDDMEATLIEKGASVIVDELPTVQGDQRQLRQLFQNLVSNAVKYRKKDRQPEVLLSAKTVDGNFIEASLPFETRSERFYLISVKDNGIGFDPDDAERIFRLFQRLHGKAEYEGTGVGLAIVQKVVENHQGYIWAESEPGEGAKFNVLLPINK